ncbi:hypothetical protein [Reichenbachiella ulvae]|uniref:Uncharacterized protein n=1 Tax=Reichenbachiella ulvae TaxID=2980104 RepID=A0ABT3CYS6_9BACT|nr:hypothetical protein [Reichenbachiella ulvae]MCV9388363.1 hypothetical protein [Reichenbachiella ulvae]
MIKPYTETDLIRYIYGETSSTEDDEIEKEVLNNPELKEKLSSFMGDTTVLDRLLLTPSENSLGRIFEYSLQYRDDQKSSQ